MLLIMLCNHWKRSNLHLEPTSCDYQVEKATDRNGFSRAAEYGMGRDEFCVGEVQFGKTVDRVGSCVLL